MSRLEAEALHAPSTPNRMAGTASAPAADRPRSPSHQWKLVVAANEQWQGEIYETRAGRRREAFNGPIEFLDAVRRLTGWELPM
ncbi:hypothetical protein [Nocardia australiensis]|uniref:hypothetical protein n=1 Tax=Nocardia australiensis TaxID=2887191 RepID=UPI001D1474B5|nr:hypothetical protein [Nocardia australiensis]